MRFVLSLHYNESNYLLFANAKKVNAEIKYHALCLDNISKGLTINNMKKTRLKGVAFFSWF